MKSGYDRIGHDVSVEHAKRSCLDKVGYASRNAARDRAAFLATKYPDTPRQRPYRCTICHGFHLTTKTPDGLKNRDKGKSPGQAGSRRKVA